MFIKSDREGSGWCMGIGTRLKKSLDFSLRKKDVLTTFSMKEQARVREALARNHIDYRIKIINRSSPSPMAAGMRARTGSFGNSADIMYEYVFYVHRKDLDLVRYVLRGRR